MAKTGVLLFFPADCVAGKVDEVRQEVVEKSLDLGEKEGALTLERETIAEIVVYF